MPESTQNCHPHSQVRELSRRAEGKVRSQGLTLNKAEPMGPLSEDVALIGV